MAGGIWRFLLDSPRWLFFYPGVALFLMGIGIGIWLLPGPQTIGGVTFDFHTLLFGAMAVLLGFQSINFAAFTKIFAITEGLVPEDRRLKRLFRYITLEVGLIVGGALPRACGFMDIWLRLLENASLRPPIR